MTRAATLALLLLGCGGSAQIAEPAPRVAVDREVDRELLDTIEALERMWVLLAHPRVGALLAIAYERADRVADARRMLDRLERETIDERLQQRIAALEARLGQRERGGLFEDDPALREWVVRQAGHFERSFERQRDGEVDCCP